MSLAIGFKGAEGIVLAADSRVTLNNVVDLPGAPAGAPQKVLIAATFDNATKLLNIKSQTHVGAVTFGTASIGQAAPRTVASFLPEFEDELGKANKGRLSVEAFAKELGKFFTAQWNKEKMPNPPTPGNEMVFMVGGYDAGAAHGRIFHVVVPTIPDPKEFAAGEFGATWGGQRQFVDRLMGFDPGVPKHVYDIMKIQADQQKLGAFELELKKKLGLPIPWQFLPLQDCIDLSVFLIRMTIQMQQWLVSPRGVGGAIDVATITRTDGFKAVQLKELQGENVLDLRSVS